MILHHALWSLQSLILLNLANGGNGVSVCPTRQLRSTSGEVTSPAHPGKYSSDTDCSLTILSTPGSTIRIKFHSLDVEADQDEASECKADAFILVDGAQIHRYCSENVDQIDLPKDVLTTGNKLVVKLRTDGSYEYNGFRITYTTERQPTNPPKVTGDSICPSRHIKNKLGGAFFSPHFPSSYSHNKKCRIKINIPENYQMNVWFTSFELQKSPGCRSDRLNVKDDLGGVSLCGGGQHRLPALQVLRGTEAKIQFYSDGQITSKGFHLHYNMTQLIRGNCMCTYGTSYIKVMNFDKKINRLQQDIRFQIKTSQSRGLIMFSKGTLRDYIYIGIKNGNIFYDTDLGTGSNKAVANDVKVNDNLWHSVVITRRKRQLSISVDNGKAVGMATTRGIFNKIDLPQSAGLYLGAPSHVRHAANFLGCIRDFSMDGRHPLTNAYAQKYEYESVGRERMKECHT